jgi:4-hydroxymandelate oxidase
VLVDGGIRRGTDIVKAIALGADAVMVGRPYLYGLGIGGAEGVRRVIEILRVELEQAMALCGRTTLASIDESVLWDGLPGAAARSPELTLSRGK